MCDAVVRPALRRMNRSSLGAKLVRTARIELERFYARRIVTQGLASLLPQFTFNYARTLLLRAGGLVVGENTLVMGALTVTGPGDWRELLSIGSNTIVTGPLYIDLGAEVRIGNLVRIGHHVLLLTVNHEIGSALLRCGPHSFAPIVIGDGAWIASRVTILPGVTVGSGAVVAAGAVVTSDVAPNTLVGGVPAKLIRELDGDGR